MATIKGKSTYRTPGALSRGRAAEGSPAKPPRPVPRPQTVPSECTGRWVAWSPDGLRIVAAGDGPGQARAAALAVGVPDSLLEWIPPRDELRGKPARGAAGAP